MIDHRLAFLALCLFWGGTWLAIRIAVIEVSPMLVAWAGGFGRDPHLDDQFRGGILGRSCFRRSHWSFRTVKPVARNAQRRIALFKVVHNGHAPDAGEQAGEGLILHSDRRGRHCAQVCQKLLCASGRQAPMSTKRGRDGQSVTALSDRNTVRKDSRWKASTRHLMRGLTFTFRDLSWKQICQARPL